MMKEDTVRTVGVLQSAAGHENCTRDQESNSGFLVLVRNLQGKFLGHMI